MLAGNYAFSLADLGRGIVDQAVAKARGALAGFEHNGSARHCSLRRSWNARGEHPKALASLQSALIEFDGAAGPTVPATTEARRLFAEWQARIQ